MNEEYDTLQHNQIYLDWQKEHKDCYLAHIFTMRDSQFEPAWHFGYYDEKQDKITSFIVAGATVTKEEHSDLAKQPDTKVLPLDLSSVKITQERAQQIVDEIIEKGNYGGSKTKVFLLQHIAVVGTVWNVTVVTLTWKTVNVKIDAASGEVKLQSEQNLLDMRANSQTE